MLVGVGLITSNRYSYVFIAELGQVVITSPAVCPYFGILLDVGQDGRLQCFLLSIRYYLKAQPTRNKTAAMSSSVLRTLASRQVRVRAKGFFPRQDLHHADNKRFVMPSSSFPLCCATNVRFVYLHWPFSTNLVSPGPNHCGAELVQH